MFNNRLQLIFSSSSPKTIVLCYHRIATDKLDPWQLAVTPQIFEEQLQMLKRKYTPISIDRLSGRGKQPTRSRSICITFDDGYTDNYTIAKPLLEKYNLPACFFVSSGYTGQRSLFWWDELTAIVLGSTQLPPKLALQIKDENLEFDFSGCTVLRDHEKVLLNDWKAKDKPVSDRCRLYLQLWELIRSLNAQEIRSVMNKLRIWSGFVTEEKMVDKFPMTEEQLTRLAENKMFTIGLHTANHVALDFHAISVQEDELQKNRSTLQRILRKEANVISFPFGRYNDDTLKLVRNHNIAGFTSEKKVVRKHSLSTPIGRFAVGNWNGKKLDGKLNNWFATR